MGSILPYRRWRIIGLLLVFLGVTNYATFKWTKRSSSGEQPRDGRDAVIATYRETPPTSRPQNIPKLPVIGTLTRVPLPVAKLNEVGNVRPPAPPPQNIANIPKLPVIDTRTQVWAQDGEAVKAAKTAQTAAYNTAKTTRPQNVIKQNVLDEAERVDNSELRIVYNKVPKCGSSAVQAVLSLIGARYNYDFRGVISSDNAMTNISEAEQMTIVREVNHLTTPVIYSRHMYFVNFTRFHSPMPMYINVVREPLERMVSHYYYYMNGLNRSYPRPFDLKSKKFTIDECLDLPDTLMDAGRCPTPRKDWNSAVVFFCGYDDVCEARDAQTLAMAKTNVVKHYSVVGLHEDLPSFFDVLDILAPRIFRTTAELFSNASDRMYHEYSTAAKIPPSPGTAAYMKKMAALEYDFYHFIKKRFYEQIAFLGLSRRVPKKTTR